MARKKSKIKGKKLSTGQLQHEVFKLLKRFPGKRFSAKQIIKKLRIQNNKDSVNYALNQLQEAEKVRHVKDGKFKVTKTPGGSRDNSNGRPSQKGGKTHVGIVDMTQSGSAYIICEGLEDDVFVAAKNLNGALNGDRVKIQLFRSRRRRPDGEVLEVMERSQSHFLGTIRLWQKYGIVTPDNLKTTLDIRIPVEDTKGADDGEKVVVQIVSWPERHNHSPIGKVTAVLGAEGSNEIAMKSILINNGFQLEFPEMVMKEADALPTEISEAEIFRRRDIRHIPTFTIDPADAKDFDDALSLRYLENGLCEIGVHIADVTHYIKPGTPLDEEALKRSTSVYLVDRVLPMLPEKLSNELCSLRPNEDKCTFSAIFTFDKNDAVVNRWFGKTLIHSDRRFTYEEAQEIMDGAKGDFQDELKLLNRVAHNLRRRRFKNGSISFESDEVRFELDEQGKPISVFKKERKDAHLLVEDFMLLANREVAAFIAEKGKDQEIPFVYRVHDTPDPDRLAEFSQFAKQMGVDIHTDSPRAIANSLNKLADRAKEEPALRLLEPLAIRTMAKAEYTSDNIGHYGLAFDHYTHFTSPIRRYSDVLVHRLLERNLSGVYRMRKAKLEEMCQHISRQERRAVSAERESVKYKQVEFIREHIGDVFEGYVSGIIDRGFFVALADSLSEGLVAFNSLKDTFELQNGRLQAKGIHTGRLIKMGDVVKVRILGADLEKREIDMELVDEEK